MPGFPCVPHPFSRSVFATDPGPGKNDAIKTGNDIDNAFIPCKGNRGNTPGTGKGVKLSEIPGDL
jgi:hypothetical protein